MAGARSAFLAADFGSELSGRRRLAAIGRRAVRWLQARSFAVAPDQVRIAEGLRAATMVALLVFAAWALHRPVLAWAAFSAFWTCLADPGGSDRRRLRVMGVFALGGAVVAALMSAVAGLGPAFVAPTLFAVVGLCGLSRILGANMAQAGLLANVVAVVAADQPAAAPSALVLGGIFLGGGLLALVLCLKVWRIHPHCAARRAVAAIFSELLEMAADLAGASPAGAPDAGRARRLESEHRWAVRNAIERARSKVDQLEAWRRDDPVSSGLTAAVEACDRIFAGLIALGHAHVGQSGGQSGGQGDAAAAPVPHDLLDALAAALAEGRRQALQPEPDWAELRACAWRLALQAGAAEGLVFRVADAWRGALLDLADGRPSTVEGASTLRPAFANASDRRLVLAAVRHALRVATVVLAAYLVTARLSLPCGYWASVAAVVVMQPRAEGAWPRGLERIVGSLVGGLAAAALPSLLTAPWQLLVIIFPLAAATIAVRSVNYTLFVLFLTPLFVLVADLITPGRGLALARAADNVLGSLLALAGCLLLWPERRSAPLARRLAEAIEANLAYADLVCAPGAAGDRVEAARRRAGISNSAVEESLHRMRLEGRRRRARLDQAAAVVAALRRLGGAATVAWLSGEGGAAGRGLRFSTLANRLGALVRGVREAEADAPFGRPQGSLDALVAELSEACRAYAAPARDAEGVTAGRRLS